MTRPNKLEGLPLVSLSSNVLEFESKLEYLSPASIASLLVKQNPALLKNLSGDLL
jgi:hypothetical protein